MACVKNSNNRLSLIFVSLHETLRNKRGIKAFLFLITIKTVK